MDAPLCPHCHQPITRALDLPYGWWEWEGDGYHLKTASARVDVAPWVHDECMGELRSFHPHDTGTPVMRPVARR
jgi:hypothetical protein